MDLQGKEGSQPSSVMLTSASTTEFNSYSTTEFNSYSTVSTNDSPERSTFNLPKSHTVINLPPSQQINRAYEAPDPNRIPQSIFARSSSRSAQMEWSVTSNESLFSIHVPKASDLTNVYADNNDSSHTGMPRDTTQGRKEGINGPLIEAESEHLDGDIEEKSEVNDHLSTTPNLNFNFSALTTPCESPGSRMSGFSGLQSDSSTLSHNSFAFPVLTKDAKGKSVRNDLMHQLIVKDKSHREPPFPETTPITEKTVPQQNANAGWKSYFYCCSFNH